MIDWSKYPNFSEDEFRCSQTGVAHVHPEFMDRLQKLRNIYGLPIVITSGYRHELHPIEAKKREPGAHTTGRACDIAVQGSDALEIVLLAVDCGFTGIGVHQKGSGRFIHLDDLPTKKGRPRPWIWSY